MHILESIRNILQIIGLSSYQSIQTSPFNTRNLMSLFVLVLNIICNVGYSITGQTENLMEFTDSVFITFTVTVDILILINLIWQMQQLFVFINGLEDIVVGSKQIENAALKRNIFRKFQRKFYSENPFKPMYAFRTRVSRIENNL